MKKLFEKNEVMFAVVLIIIYVVGSSVILNISDDELVQNIAAAAFNAVMTVFLLVFIRKNALMKHIGLCRSEVSAARMWFYIPLVICAAGSLCFGIGLEMSPTATVFRTVKMLFVGFLEEVIFRGFLFKGISKSNVTRAIVISSVTFGVGHIVNLFNGYDLFYNIMQIIFAVAVGFLLVFIFHRTGSLIACIGFHSLNNCVTGFTTAEYLIKALGSEETASIVLVGVKIVVIVIYMLYVIKLPKRQPTADTTRVH
ncbi:MAG: CPBP family intramembrane metalloprotease [Oscillospiraceae bacterium]|nr:CPBP family intramembrane metalloprotease [Oscillospiraceae bacterium]